jgi:tRNA U34 5-methylaminomethyl-2-thiouridine-forming methyltransferase MnmC
VEKPVPHITRDGSHTLYSPRFRQYYHNPNGAIEESIHVFFHTTGLLDDLAANKPVTILETGFGTGLNFLLLLHLRDLHGHTAPVLFQSLDAWPPGPEVMAGINHPELLDRAGLRDVILTIFGQLQKGVNNRFTFGDVDVRVFHGQFDAFDPDRSPSATAHATARTSDPFRANYLFHDPFSIEVNPELWTSPVFKKLLGWSAGEAVLGTYAAATRARAAMAHAGWYVARAPGALGKREMTLASRHPERLDGYHRLNEARLASRYENGEFG